MADKAAGWNCGCWITILFIAISGAVAWINTGKRRTANIKAVVQAADQVASRLQNDAPPGSDDGLPPEDDVVFWPGATQRSARGYLMSDKYIPLRAIPRKPNVSLFQSDAVKYPEGAKDICKPWLPYYVFERKENGKQNGVLNIAKRVNAAQVLRLWAQEYECFCWTTRECLNIENPTPIYASREDAETGMNPIDASYTYRYAGHFVSAVTGDASQLFGTAALPVLQREGGKYWCFVSTRGTARGYQAYWLKWDPDQDTRGIKCRIRVERKAFDNYVEGLRTLMDDWKNPEKRAESKRGLYDHGLADLAQGAEKLGATGSLNQLRARRQGVPKLTGFLERPITNELQYDVMKDRVVKLLQLSLGDIWDGKDVAYIPVEQLP